MENNTWIWLVARTNTRTTGIITTLASENKIAKFCDRAEVVGALLEHITRPAGRHWDGSKMNEADLRRYGA